MLDKQKILSELGNVVSQLQSADCGCMGKLFSPSRQPNNTNMAMTAAGGGCQSGGCCHGHGCRGYNSPCAGEPCQGPGHCMGSCNPPKLYADTYGYLNQNLMQPVVKEVYDDLKSITPQNTMMNNPMAAQMGIPLNNYQMSAGSGNMNSAMLPAHQAPRQELYSGGNMGHNHVPHLHFGQPQVDNTHTNDTQNSNYFNQTGRPAGCMGGMGPQIVNMMHSNNQRQTPNSIGDVPQHNLNGTKNLTNNVDHMQYNSGIAANNIPHNTGYTQSSVMQPVNVNQSNMHESGNANANKNFNGNSGFQAMQNAYPNAVQPMNTQNTYGQHSAGITKFKEMFPGVMQGDLGFDPMAIAIQMNPANQQKAAMNTMHKMMSNNAGGINNIIDSSKSPFMQPVTNTSNAPSGQANQPVPNTMYSARDETLTQNNQIPQQGFATSNGTPTPTQLYHQQIMDPNRRAAVGNLPTLLEGSGDAETQEMEPSGQQSYKEPILPADTSRQTPPQLGAAPQKSYYYNTLGQPVEMIPADIYRSPEMPNLPQTLSPQPSKPNYSNVKYTMSKTALMGRKAVGKTPSRSQLQNIYNQYKGSQSYTQQFVKPSQRGVSFSEGNLNASQGTSHQVSPIEREGGDTALNNNIKSPVNEMAKANSDDNKPPPMEGEKPIPSKKSRNGLQDVVFTSYPTSAAWSFHGNR